MAVVLGVAGVVWLGWVIVDQSNPEVTSELIGFTVDGEHTAVGIIEVARSSETTRATCFLRALSIDHAIVGELALPVTEGAKKQRVDFTMRTERAATSIELLGCSTPDQKQRR
ncbi:MAG: DUF4307 domain-containing protein [Nocardioidaceae bacterium]|nr:MAG: DUF4307 domain-containing protein [Nocardioidaceae bacterium]